MAAQAAEHVDQAELNSSPKIEVLEKTTMFYVEPNDETGPYVIELGKAFDEQGDEFTIEFDSQRLDFIRLQ